MKKILGVVLALGLIIFIGSKFFIKPDSHIPANEPEDLPGQITGTVPWPAETTQLLDRLLIIDLPALSVEGTLLHTHQHLDIYINGQKIDVPAGIGIGPNSIYVSPIHTHDTAGFIHVESPTVKNFYLGQFFDVWGLRFNDQCIGGYCTSGNKKLRLFDNGQEMSGNLRDLKLSPHQEIVVFYGTDSQLLQPVPSGFIFPPGY